MKKIVIKVDVHCDKGRSKALKIAAVVQGVNSVSLGGESRDQIVVTGNGVDSVCLTTQLRKKFRNATILSVEDVKSGPTKPAANTGNKKSQECHYSQCYCPPPCPLYYEVVYDPNPNACSIL